MAEALWTSGQVAAALGYPRQLVTDLLRRAHLRHSGEGVHARFSLGQALAVAVARRLADMGLDLRVAGLVVADAEARLVSLAPNLAAPIPAADLHLVAWLADAGAHDAVATRVLPLGEAALVDLSAFPQPPVMLAVPLAPLLGRLVAGLPWRGAD